MEVGRGNSGSAILKRICVLGDTHVKNWQDIPAVLKREFLTSDYILHLGDFVSLEVLEEFRKLNKFRGVSGNHDGRRLRHFLPRQDIIELEGYRLGVLHGHGCFWPWGLRPGLRKRFEGEKLDAILYGHTHRVNNKVNDGTLFFNPGSAAGRFPSSGQSYGIITLNGSISAELFGIQRTPGERRWSLDKIFPL